MYATRTFPNAKAAVVAILLMAALLRRRPTAAGPQLSTVVTVAVAMACATTAPQRMRM